MEWISNPEAWIALATLTVLEIVLGIDNIVFISILSSKLPAEQQNKARVLGLLLALFGRVILLLSLSWIMRLESELFRLFDHGFSGRDLILLAGGLFLLGKATHEIHSEMEGDHAEKETKAATFRSVIVQILILDIVFSLDSVITAVGMVDNIWIMIAAIIIAVGVMVSLFQTITSINDQTLTFVPKLVIVGIVIIGSAPWMIRSLMEFTTSIISRIPQMTN